MLWAVTNSKLRSVINHVKYLYSCTGMLFYFNLSSSLVNVSCLHHFDAEVEGPDW